MRSLPGFILPPWPIIGKITKVKPLVFLETSGLVQG
jgi:hypothetical protein